MPPLLFGGVFVTAMNMGRALMFLSGLRGGAWLRDWRMSATIQLFAAAMVATVGFPGSHWWIGLAFGSVGIGAGAGTDGQVIVVPDLLGMTRMKLRHITPYEEFYQRGVEAVRAYAADVRAGKFPSRENSWHLGDGETDAFRRHFTH